MYVSAGTEPLPEIEVPDVQSMGLSQADAITKLQEAGFIVNVDNITVVNSDRYDGKAGIVLEQSPAPGEKPVSYTHLDMVEKGQLTPEEAKNHPRKHFITRALGVEETVRSDYNELEMPENGSLIICTDGLTNMVEPDDIYKIVRSTHAEDVPCLLYT